MARGHYDGSPGFDDVDASDLLSGELLEVRSRAEGSGEPCSRRLEIKTI